MYHTLEEANAAAMALSQKPPFPQRTRPPPCRVCFQRHPVLHCWARGIHHQPLWLQRNVARFYALHKDDKIEDNYKNQSPPLRHSTVLAQANKSVSFDSHPQNLPPPESVTPDVISYSATVHPSQIFVDEASFLSLHEFNDSVAHPECHMATINTESRFEEDASFIEA